MCATCRSKGARQMGARLHGERTAACSVRFLGCMAQARGSRCKEFATCRSCRWTQKFHRVAIMWKLVARKTARRPRSPSPGYSRMDDPRFSIVDVAEETGSQSTIRDQQIAARRQLRSFQSCRDATCIARSASSPDGGAQPFDR